MHAFAEALSSVGGATLVGKLFRKLAVSSKK
jgi:hypothetical protein